ncbi:hypothetical protein Tco_0331910 [Tanacetum coccineum]
MFCLRGLIFWASCIMELDIFVIIDNEEVMLWLLWTCPGPLIRLRAILGVYRLVSGANGYREPDTVMLDSEDSTVTYTAMSSPFEDGSDIGSPGVNGPPIIPEDPYAYIMAAY